MDKKYKLLLWGILFDIIGMLSFIIPFLGEFFDIFWAPFSAYIITKMFKGTEGKIAGIISFIEEAGIFGTDFIPTFTLTWIYTYLLKSNRK
ncbi:hypothetical protein [Lutibacter sp.]